MSRAVIIVIVAGIACATATRPEKSADAPQGTPDTTAIDVPVAIDGNNCATQPCSILPQCGCGTTQTCDLDFMDLMGTACRSVVSAGHETDHCSGPGNCDHGYVCLGGAANQCKKYCSSNADCGTPRGQCVIDVTNGTTVIAGLPPVCSSNCDPLSTGGCPSGEKCGLFTATHMGSNYNITDCDLAGSGIQGTNCKSGANGDNSVCGANFMCTTVDTGTTYQCRRMCNKTTPGTTCGGLTCIPFAPALSIAGIEYGVCN